MSSEQDRQFDELVEFANASGSDHNADELEDLDLDDLDFGEEAHETPKKPASEESRERTSR